VRDGCQALLTVVTRTQNSGQEWNASRTLLSNVGNAPPQVDAAAVNVSIAVDGPRTVYSLDAVGDKQAAVPSTYQNGLLAFAITPEQKSIWFAIVKPPPAP
jgi:hypothetical protein